MAFDGRDYLFVKMKKNVSVWVGESSLMGAGVPNEQ